MTRPLAADVIEGRREGGRKRMDGRKEEKGNRKTMEKYYEKEKNRNRVKTSFFLRIYLILSFSFFLSLILSTRHEVK